MHVCVSHLRTVESREFESLCLSLADGSETRLLMHSLCLSEIFLMGLIFSRGRLCQCPLSTRCIWRFIITSEREEPRVNCRKALNSNPFHRETLSSRLHPAKMYFLSGVMFFFQWSDLTLCNPPTLMTHCHEYVSISTLPAGGVRASL